MWSKLFLILSVLVVCSSKTSANSEKPEYALVIHGGAGAITPDKLTPEQEKGIKSTLHKALTKGKSILENGGTSLDAVTATIMILENSPYFNAGRGAVFTSEGKNELDSSIMDGHTLNAGAVSGVTNIKNPITAARLVMEKSPHVMLQGPGAVAFAEKNGVETAPDKYFFTEKRWQSHKKGLKKKAANLPVPQNYKYGTVGAAAMDKHGNLVAGTSTGGMTNKSHGRVGDSPIIGAGTYANNNSCALSATGHGEYFIRHTVASRICLLVEIGGISLQEAADKVVMQQLVEAGGDGGIVAVDKSGEMALVFNSDGMYRGSVSSLQDAKVAIYKN
ncbi:MAG: isoaspartyl peptidase/L-asparaginase family protein [Kordiimonas sp.]